MEPMVRNNVCLNCDPEGLERETSRQAAWYSARPIAGPVAKRVLVVGGSMGYGLASRLCASFSCGSDVVSVSFEKAPGDKKQGTPGYYNNRAADALAARKGLKSVTVEGDAFSDQVKTQACDALRAMGGKVDLLVYSIASGVRTDPVTGIEYRSALKPIGSPYSGKGIDYMTGALTDITIQPATEEEASATVKVMGGEDWERWVGKLLAEGLFSDGAMTVAYSYIGPELSRAIYREGTIGRAKDHLEKTAHKLDSELARLGGHAYVSVNKALVTRASAVIPGIALYIATLFRVMKDKGTHEGCAEQVLRLFRDRLYSGGKVPHDKSGLIRVDELEMEGDTQAEVGRRLDRAAQGGDLRELMDLEGVRRDFLAASGFGI